MPPSPGRYISITLYPPIIASQGKTVLLAVRPGQQALGPRCRQQERAGQAGTAIGTVWGRGWRCTYVCWQSGRVKGRRCWQQERAGRASTATEISRDRLSEGGAAAEVLRGSSVSCFVKFALSVESVDR